MAYFRSVAISKRAVKHLVKFHHQCPPTSQEKASSLVGFIREDHVNRNRLIAGLAILAVFMILVVFGSNLLFKEWNNRQPQIGQREPLPSLSYCSSSQIRPCILAFNLDADGKMIVNVLADGSSAKFYLKIKKDGQDNTYKCQKVQGFLTNFFCTGEKMPVGEAFSFIIVSTEDNIPLAEGTFPIIGLAIATPDIFVTPTFIPAFDRPPK